MNAILLLVLHQGPYYSYFPWQRAVSDPLYLPTYYNCHCHSNSTISCHVKQSHYKTHNCVFKWSYDTFLGDSFLLSNNEWVLYILMCSAKWEVKTPRDANVCTNYQHWCHNCACTMSLIGKRLRQVNHVKGEQIAIGKMIQGDNWPCY